MICGYVCASEGAWVWILEEVWPAGKRFHRYGHQSGNVYLAERSNET